jgi:5-methylcytosine-specific restriction endonuclease McrA
MSERVLAYFAKLERLSSEDLDRSARELAVRGKQDDACLIAHIAEIGKRDYHLELRYGSLFEYCVDRLNLSEGAVYRRTQVARVCRRYPQILEALSTGRLHLTGASLVAPHLTEDNVESVITQAQGKTRRDIEKLLATLAPKEAFEPSFRKQPSREKKATTERKPSPPTGGQRTGDLFTPATEDRYNVRFSAGKEFTDKFERLAEVLGVESPHRHMEEILGLALEIALEKKDPQRKLERRRKREARKPSARPGERETSESPAVTRRVPPEVRERVLERAGYQCEYCGPDGSRCSSRTGLQVEHTKPFAVYQTHDERYLRAFCPAHNLFAARQFYGSEFIQQKIDAARTRLEAEIASP